MTIYNYVRLSLVIHYDKGIRKNREERREREQFLRVERRFVCRNGYMESQCV